MLQLTYLTNANFVETETRVRAKNVKSHAEFEISQFFKTETHFELIPISNGIEAFSRNELGFPDTFLIDFKKISYVHLKVWRN